MINYEIKNGNILAILEEYRKLIIDDFDVTKTSVMHGKKSSAEHWCSEEHRLHIMNEGTGHDGYPEMSKSYGLKSDSQTLFNKDYRERFSDITYRFSTELGIHVNALSQLYPPEGFISWHNNANAPGYNLLFTWSETGDGWFKYVDKYGEVITLPDKKGWSLKAGYFGTYEENEEFYHAAYTKCWRITQSFIVAREEKDFWLDCLDYIQSE
jgi:hypothetical protein